MATVIKLKKIKEVPSLRHILNLLLYADTWLQIAEYTVPSQCLKTQENQLQYLVSKDKVLAQLAPLLSRMS